MHEIQAELFKMTKVKPKPNEDRQHFLRRLWEGADKLDDATWGKLTRDTAMWVNAATDAVKSDQEIADFEPEEEVAETEDEATEQAEADPPREPEDDEEAEEAEDDEEDEEEPDEETAEAEEGEAEQAEEEPAEEPEEEPAEEPEPVEEDEEEEDEAPRPRAAKPVTKPVTKILPKKAPLPPAKVAKPVPKPVQKLAPKPVAKPEPAVATATARVRPKTGGYVATNTRPVPRNGMELTEVPTGESAMGQVGTTVRQIMLKDFNISVDAVREKVEKKLGTSVSKITVRSAHSNFRITVSELRRADPKVVRALLETGVKRSA